MIIWSQAEVEVVRRTIGESATGRQEIGRSLRFWFGG